MLDKQKLYYTTSTI